MLVRKIWLLRKSCLLVRKQTVCARGLNWMFTLLCWRKSWDVGSCQNPSWKQPSCAQFAFPPGSPRSSNPGLLVHFLVPFSSTLLPTLLLLSMMRMSGSCPASLQFQSWNGKNQLCLYNWDLTICPSLLNAGRLESVHAQHGEVSLWHGEFSERGWKTLSDRNSGLVSNWCTLHWNISVFCCSAISTNSFQNLKQNYV